MPSRTSADATDAVTVMILCGRSPRHLYIANRLCAAAKPLAIVQETGAQWTAARFARQLAPANLWRKGSRWLRDRRRYRGGAEARFFFGDREPKLMQPELRVLVPHINHPDVAALAARLSPDVIAVFGTSLIRGPLLGCARLGIYTLHGGLSPWYRGADCTFWALYNGEPEQVGCTLHRIDAGIDTGNLIAHVCPEVRDGDDELTLFWRAVRDSAEVYATLLERLRDGNVRGEPQRERGRLYQVRQRGWRQERALAKRMAEGLLSGIDLPPRVRWFATGQPAQQTTKTLERATR